MFRFSFAILPVAFCFIPFLNTVLGLCLPCQVAFQVRQPSFPQPRLAGRSAWAPHITSPNSRTIWVMDQLQVVTWNTTDMPSELRNPTCEIYLEERAGKSWKIYLDHPIVVDRCNLYDGNATVKVPSGSWLKPGNDWSVVVIGDTAADHSSAFAIVSTPEGL